MMSLLPSAPARTSGTRLRPGYNRALWLLLGLSTLLPSCARSDGREEIARRELAVSRPSNSFEVFVAALPGVTLGATEWLDVGDRVRVGAADTGYGAISHLGAGALRIGVEAETGPVWSRGPVALGDRSRVNGDLFHVTSLQRGNGVAVGGPHLVGSIGPGVTVAFPSAELGNPRGDRRLEPNQSADLAPGAYGTLALKNNSVARLGSGKYLFSEIIADSGSRIEVDSLCGVVEVAVASTLLYRATTVEVSGNEGSGLTLLYSGTNTAHIEAPFRGQIVAPNAELILNASTHVGRFFAKRLRVQAGATILPRFELSGSYCAPGAAPEFSGYCESELCCPGSSEQSSQVVSNSCNVLGSSDCAVGTPQSDDIDLSTTSIPLFFGRGGDDRVRDGGVTRVILGGAGDDVLCGSGPKTVLLGGPGNDVLVFAGVSGQTEGHVAPGSGADRIVVRAGTVNITTFDACELGEDDSIEVSPGASVQLWTQLSEQQLRERGVALPPGAAVHQVRGNRCLSSCAGAPVCEGDAFCIDDSRGLRCESTNSSLTVSAGSLGALLPGLSPELVNELSEVLRDPGFGSTSGMAPLSVRQQAEVLVPALVHVVRTTNDIHVRRAFIGLVGSLYRSSDVPLLQEFALQEPSTPLELGDAGGPLVSWYSGNSAAVRWLRARSARGDASSDLALLEVARLGSRLPREDAAMAFLANGDTAERRAGLDAVLPPDGKYLLGIERRTP